MILGERSPVEQPDGDEDDRAAEGPEQVMGLGGHAVVDDVDDDKGKHDRHEGPPGKAARDDLRGDEVWWP